MRRRITMATTVSPCQMPGSQAIMSVCCSKNPKLTLPLLTIGEDHAASSPDWESGRHWHMEVVSAHSFSRRGPLSGYLLRWWPLQCKDSRAVVSITVIHYGSCSVGPRSVLRSSEVWASCQFWGTCCAWAERCLVGGPCTHAAREVL